MDSSLNNQNLTNPNEKSQQGQEQSKVPPLTSLNIVTKIQH